MFIIFGLFVILISSDGILGLSRKARTTQGDSTGHLTTDRNAVAEYISQKIKGIEQATELNGNPNFSPGSAPNLGPGIVFGSPPRAKQQKEPSILTPGQYFHEGSNPAILAPNPSILNNQKSDAPTKKLHHSMKSNGDDHGRMFEPSSRKPDGYAMRISSETFEIDATIDASNNTGDVRQGNWSNLSESESDNGYSDSEEVSGNEKITQTTEEPGTEEGEVSMTVTTMDPVDEEIRHVLDALPKLPELTFSENGTYHKDPEEVSLDDRITQVARQLAENSLRRKYEEQKLGHYIPIRLRHFDDDYPANAFTSARKFSSDKAYSNAFDILHQIQQPQVRFRALSIPEHIYSSPLYRPNEQSYQSKMELSNSGVYHPETAMSPMFNPNGFGAIVQLGPRYVLPVQKVSLDQNRIPIFFGFTQPKPVQTFHNHNDLNTYPYREIE